MHLNTFIFSIYNMRETKKKKDRPDASSKNEKPKLPEPKTDAIRKHRKVLFVDDEESMVSLHKAMLKSKDREVTVFTAISGKEALEILAKESDIDLIVSDYNMRGESGIDLICKVIDDYPDVKTLLFTSQVDKAEEEAIRKDLVGLEIMLKSPETLDEFYQRVMDILHNE